MGKMKTNKATSKRFKFTGGKKGKKKIVHRRGGQDHFNARQTGKQTTRKRRDRTVSKSEVKSIKKLMPYH